MKGVAWTLPAVAVAAPAPAFAASPCTVPPLIPPFPLAGTSNTNWLISTSGGVQSGSARFVGGSFVVDTDPALNATYIANATYRGPAINLTANFTYKLTVAYTVVTSNPRPAIHTLLLNGVAVKTFDTDLTTSAGSYVVPYTPTATGPLSIVVRFQISGTGSTVGDDITITSLVASC